MWPSTLAVAPYACLVVSWRDLLGTMTVSDQAETSPELT